MRDVRTWEQCKFIEILDCTIPNNSLSREKLSSENGTVLNIHYGDVLTKYSDVLDVSNCDIPFIKGKNAEDFKGALLCDGDIIFADTAEDETVGKACEISNSKGHNIVAGLHTIACRPRVEIASSYLGHYFNSGVYRQQFRPLMQGVKDLSLSRANIQKTNVSYPINKKEQYQIACLFQSIDRLVTLHQRKRKKLWYQFESKNRNDNYFCIMIFETS